jgi:GrpB-like predicted nucleotidyltransferase (UPF0157 family)/ribosomal protein S18 acetylase RimI-like enzyme
MRLEVTDAPREEEEAFVIAQTRSYNAAFAEEDVRSVCVFTRDDTGTIIGGLTGKTYWRYLDIAFLWVEEKHRGRGLATQLMAAAEAEARRRGCEHALLDTPSFQALGFYRKLGYTEFGRLSGFSGKHDRHYLYKMLGEESKNSDTDPLVIRDYDPAWPDQFSDLASRVTAALGALQLRVEHIGSTAVPGLAAKPVIDMDVVLASPSDLPEAIRRLRVLGYVHEGDLGIVGREAFRWPPDEARHHLYVLIAGAEALRRHLAFRDALLSNRIIRDAYSELKKDLALRYSHDRKSYTEAKSAFIARIVGRE